MSIASSIGNTPLVELKRLNPNPKVRLFAQLEGSNPSGSVKDRPTLYMIEKAEESGELTHDKTIQGLKNMTEAIVPEIYDNSLLDDIIPMEDEEAFATARRLAAEEGIFAGLSSGAAVAGALRLAAGMKSGTIVTIIADRGERYLSTMLFRSVCAKCPP